MPFTLMPEEPAAAAPAPSRFTVVDETPQAPPTDPRESYAAGIASTLPMAYGAGAVNYALQGGAPGSFDQGYQQFESRSNKAWEDNPKTAAAGFGTGIGLGLATGGPGLVGGVAKTAPRIAETGLRAGGAATRWGGGLAALLHGNLPGAYVAWEGGKKMSAMGQALRADRMARAAPKLAEEIAAAVEAPPPPSGRLSQEMLDALKRGKFRHQYHNVKGGI